MKTKCEVFTRCIGYLRPTDMMNDSKQAEIKDRHLYDQDIQKENLKNKKNTLLR